MEHKWGSYFGRLVFNSCKESLQKPMQLLECFEAAGKAAEDEGKFLSWRVPITDFPVVQHYVEGSVKKVYVQYGPPRGERLSTGYFENTFQLNVCYPEKPVNSKGKQSQGASPNIIHSIDAAHLMLIVEKCPFPVTTIHDSFGCLLSDMDDLFRIVRETFVQLHEEDLLEDIMYQIGGELTAIEFGTLCITDVLDSEYAFV